MCIAENIIYTNLFFFSYDIKEENKDHKNTSAFVETKDDTIDGIPISESFLDKVELDTPLNYSEKNGRYLLPFIYFKTLWIALLLMS